MYHALQDPSDAVSLDDLAAMDKQIHDLGEAIATAKAHEKLLRANLIAVNATQSTDDLRANIITLESEKKEILARLGPLRSGTVTPVSSADKDEVDQAWKMWSRAAGARKRIGLELWELCTEEMQAQAKEDLWVWRIFSKFMWDLLVTDLGAFRTSWVWKTVTHDMVASGVADLSAMRWLNISCHGECRYFKHKFQLCYSVLLP